MSDTSKPESNPARAVGASVETAIEIGNDDDQETEAEAQVDTAPTSVPHKPLQYCMASDWKPVTESGEPRTALNIRNEVLMYMLRKKVSEKSMADRLHLDVDVFQTFMDAASYHKDHPWNDTQESVYMMAARFMETHRQFSKKKPVRPKRSRSFLPQRQMRYWMASDWKPVHESGEPRTAQNVRNELANYMVQHKLTETSMADHLRVDANVFEKFMDADTYNRDRPWDVTLESVFITAARFMETHWYYSKNKPARLGPSRYEKMLAIAEKRKFLAPSFQIAVFDSCEKVAERICTYLTHEGLTKCDFCKVALEEKCSVKELNWFVTLKNGQMPSDSLVYELAYSFFEAKRIMDGKSISLQRRKFQKDNPNGFPRTARPPPPFAVLQPSSDGSRHHLPPYTAAQQIDFSPKRKPRPSQPATLQQSVQSSPTMQPHMQFDAQPNIQASHAQQQLQPDDDDLDVVSIHSFHLLPE